MSLIEISDINGNLESLKKSVISEIQSLKDLDYPKGDFLPWELADKLAEITTAINREISVYLDRKGEISGISIGDSNTVSLPKVTGRRGRQRLSGIRCIHTHPNGDGMLSQVDINSMLALNLDAMVSVGVSQCKITNAYAAIPALDEKGERKESSVFGPYKRGQNMDVMFEYIKDIENANLETVSTDDGEKERAILVGLESEAVRLINGKSEGERSLEELEELSVTAGLLVVEKVLQKRPQKDSAFYIGRGKTEELSLLCQAVNAGTLVFDDELSGSQIRNIERVTGAKVVDRTTLILDIFAQRARSSEGKLQVELAQLKYRLPRLSGLGGQLSRLGGGIGTRGPGEKQLETDRRHIRRRIATLEEELKQLGKRRDLIRRSRKKNAVPIVALVGYTNSGKSTLLNKLCGTNVLAEDKLFATLDPTARSLALPDGSQAILVDTVGFIRKLPHELIDAFKSTLEEAVSADVLLHVVDIADEEADEQIAVVDKLLNELGVYDKPVILVLNKMDIAKQGIRPAIPTNGRKSVQISALLGLGLDELLKAIAETITPVQREMDLLIPYDKGWALFYVHENGYIIEKDYTEEGIRIKAKIDKSKEAKIREFAVTAGEVK